jgi:flagellar motility protein MotE (MotC chaperone)
MPDMDKEEKKEQAKKAKEEKKNRRKQKKDADENPGQEELEQEKLGSKLLLVVVTILIIVIWIGIIALLIKTDVGGFGSSVLYPVFKDVPYMNLILPENESEAESEVDTQYRYDSTEDAVTRIKELELLLAESQQNESDAQDEIEKLQKENADLAQYKEEQAAFELEKEKFYEEVVFGDNAPDINEYKTFYESIDPENAEVLYKQVVEQAAYDDSMEEYVKTYSSMKAKSAAAIFDTMTDDLGLVADILNNMDTQSRADILAAMDSENAAKITQILEPSN